MRGRPTNIPSPSQVYFQLQWMRDEARNARQLGIRPVLLSTDAEMLDYAMEWIVWLTTLEGEIGEEQKEEVKDALGDK